MESIPELLFWKLSKGFVYLWWWQLGRVIHRRDRDQHSNRSRRSNMPSLRCQLPLVQVHCFYLLTMQGRIFPAWSTYLVHGSFHRHCDQFLPIVPNSHLQHVPASFIQHRSQMPIRMSNLLLFSNLPHLIQQCQWLTWYQFRDVQKLYGYSYRTIRQRQQ